MSASPALRFGLRELLCEQTRDLYDAVLQFREELAELRLAAVSSELVELIDEMQLAASEGATALERVCDLLGVPPDGVDCQAMKGLIRECKEAAYEWHDSATRDAAIVANSQRVVHYAIAGFGTAASFARCLKLAEAETLFKGLLKNAVTMDGRLTKLATGGWFTPGINDEAAR